MNLDLQLLGWINLGWAHPWLDTLFWGVSQRNTFGLPLLLLLLAACVKRFGRDGLKLWILMLAVFLCADLLASGLKQLFAQPRPCVGYFDVYRFHNRDYDGPCKALTTGMPSSHASNFFAVAVFLSLSFRSRPWTLFLFGVSVLVALSRIYLARHFPSQVLAGILFGSGLGGLAFWLGARYLAVMKRVLSRGRRDPDDQPNAESKGVA